MRLNCILLLAAPLLAASFQALSLPQITSVTPSSAFLSQSADSESETTRISIEYCTGCRWMLKSFWMAQELLTTFEDEVDAITIVPSRTTNGVFAVRLNGDSLLWDRKEKGGFPTPKGLKQIVRDMVAPELNLGHSDTEARQAEKKESEEKETAREEVEIDIKLAESEAPQPTVTIHYCTGCRWLLRAAYFGQELLTTFDKEINSVTLMPSKPPDKGGRFSIELNGKLLFDRATEGRFPEVKEIKQMIRDQLDPDMDLGHSDTQEMDDDEAAQARKLFGVE